MTVDPPAPGDPPGTRAHHCWHWTERGAVTTGSTTTASVRCCWCGMEGTAVTSPSHAPADGHGHYGPTGVKTKYSEEGRCFPYEG